VSVTTSHKPRMTVPEFLAWSERQPDDRYELVDGEIVAMTRDTVRHNQSKFAASRAMDDAIRSAGLPCLVLIDGVGVVVSNDTLRIPDVLVDCGPEPDPNAMVVEAPLIVVEVSSPSSERDDFNIKLIDYFKIPSIRHYLIVLPEPRYVIHHERNDAGEIATHIAHDGEIQLNPPGIKLAVAALLGPQSAEERAP
jgi:Uma2 family endonuclease